jgi:glutamate/tyrosine decarboxylase-like PLP-dependent enzyme
VSYYKKRLVALFCSTPSYAYGVVDDVELFSDIVEQYKKYEGYNIGLHIDVCLGGFVINYLMDCKYFKYSGVTSISIDPHKNALTPKDVSVILCKNLGGKNLMYYSIYAIERWNMLYGTPLDNGSKGIVLPFCALVTLLYNGENFYKEQALKINKTILELKKFLEETGEFEIITKEPVNVLAFKLNEKYKYGLTYKLNDLLEEKGFELTALNNDIIHICITTRFCEMDSLKKLQSDIIDCIKKIKKIKDIKNYEYDGTAKLYCSINMAMNPKKNFSFKYLGELLFGKQMVIDIIKNYYLSLLNPKYKK